MRCELVECVRVIMSVSGGKKVALREEGKKGGWVCSESDSSRSEKFVKGRNGKSHSILVHVV